MRRKANRLVSGRSDVAVAVAQSPLRRREAVAACLSRSSAAIVLRIPESDQCRTRTGPPSVGAMTHTSPHAAHDHGAHSVHQHGQQHDADDHAEILDLDAEVLAEHIASITAWLPVKPPPVTSWTWAAGPEPAPSHCSIASPMPR